MRMDSDQQEFKNMEHFYYDLDGYSSETEQGELLKTILENLVKKNANIITELQKTNKLLIQKIELFKVDNLKLKLQLDSVNKKTNSINNNFDNESIKSNSENDSIINNIDTESVKSNLNNSFVKSNSDNESEEYNEIFNDNNNNNNNNLSQFIQKKTHKKINNDNDINYNLEFDDENLDDYDK